MTQRLFYLAISITVLLGFSGLNAYAGELNQASIAEGKKLYTNYCDRCHGPKLDGQGRMASIYIKQGSRPPSNLTVGFYIDRPHDYLVGVILDGGGPHGLSEFMPPFRSELNEKQVHDIVSYIKDNAIKVKASHQ
ncbi:MAG: cytochrome c [Gammaproteobacteria bacterium]|nr:cytochrome c [Gammaproteobacteria bacterium]